MENNAMKIFENAEFGQIRMVMIDEKPYFVANDVAKALGYAVPKDAVSRHCKGALKRRYLTEGGEQDVKVIPEGDIYRLIVKSKLPSAERFESWVFDEVLPSIRKHGMYATDQVIDQILGDPDFGIKLLTELKTEREARKQAEKKIEEQKPLVDFANQVSDSKNVIQIGELSNMLYKKEKIDIGRNRLFEWLRNKKILKNNNLPYQSYIERGYFVVKEGTYERNGDIFTSRTTYVTGKGQLFIANKVLTEYNTAS